MQYIDAVRAFFEKDRFAMSIGCRIEQAAKDYAKCTLSVEDRHLNAAGLVQGGVTFTLGDFAFAVAANSSGRCTVSMDTAISHTHAARGKCLFAEAQKLTETRQVVFYRVRVYDELGTDVASMQVTGYKTEKCNGLDPDAYDGCDA